MRITTRRDAGVHSVHVDGRPTAITISKGSAARYREPQEFDACCGDDYLFSAKGLHGCVRVLQAIADQLAP